MKRADTKWIAVSLGAMALMATSSALAGSPDATGFPSAANTAVVEWSAGHRIARPYRDQ